MNTQLIVYLVIISLIIGAPIAYGLMRLYRRVTWDHRLKMYKKTKNPHYLR